jgi:predicted DsbA family dithiol-disulfide isomerase
VQQAARAAGIEFAFDRIEVLPNTAAAHNLVGFVAASGTDAQRAVLVDTLFTAYFMEGENIGDYGTLASRS